MGWAVEWGEERWARCSHTCALCLAAMQVVFANGTSQVLFPNGDVKMTWPNGKVDYFYAEVRACAQQAPLPPSLPATFATPHRGVSILAAACLPGGARRSVAALCVIVMMPSSNHVYMAHAPPQRKRRPGCFGCMPLRALHVSRRWTRGSPRTPAAWRSFTLPAARRSRTGLTGSRKLCSRTAACAMWRLMGEARACACTRAHVCKAVSTCAAAWLPCGLTELGPQCTQLHGMATERQRGRQPAGSCHDGAPHALPHSMYCTYPKREGGERESQSASLQGTMS